MWAAEAGDAVPGVSKPRTHSCPTQEAQCKAARHVTLPAPERTPCASPVAGQSS